MAHWHSYNPWAARLIYVPSLEELAECVIYSRSPADTVRHWQEAGPKLDAYILPNGEGPLHCIGIRYGEAPGDYISPYAANQEKVTELIKKYSYMEHRDD